MTATPTNGTTKAEAVSPVLPEDEQLDATEALQKALKPAEDPEEIIEVFEVPVPLFNWMVATLGKLPWESVHEGMTHLLSAGLQPVKKKKASTPKK